VPLAEIAGCAVARDESGVGSSAGDTVKAKKRVSPKGAARAKPAKSPRRAKPVKRASSPEIPPVLAPVADAFADVRGVSRRRMFSSENAFSVNGKIFAMLTRGTFVVKLPKERVDDLVEAGKGKRFDPGHGRLMKEWIAVEAGALPWVALAKEAHSYVRRNGR
jgi:hypothetical protein